MRRLFILFTLAACLLFLGCGSDRPLAPLVDRNTIGASSSIQTTVVGVNDGAVSKPVSKKLQVVINSRIVQAAVEAFAARNDGIYPKDLGDRTPAGDTVIDLLPEGMLLENPYWEVRAVPHDGTAAQEGEVGYCRVSCDGMNKGYYITACGAGATPIVTLYKNCSGEIAEIIGRQDS